MQKETDNIKIAYLTKEYVKRIIPQRFANSQKRDYGTVLNIAGSLNYPGAAYLSSISALKVGAGKVVLGTTTSVIPIVASLSSAVTYVNLGENNAYTIPANACDYLRSVKNPTAYSIGCGLTMNNNTKDFVLAFLKKNINSKTPIIIDADAINAISTTFQRIMPLNSIITPHYFELARLLRVTDAEDIQKNRIKYAWSASKKFDCIVLLKGHETVIAVPNGQIFVNKTGNSALAKAGTGDVLTGMIAGYCAQGLSLEDAACIATYIHGRAGELASKVHTEYGVLAPNIINYIPVALKELLDIPLPLGQQELFGLRRRKVINKKPQKPVAPLSEDTVQKELSVKEKDEEMKRELLKEKEELAQKEAEVKRQQTLVNSEHKRSEENAQQNTFKKDEEQINSLKEVGQNDGEEIVRLDNTEDIEIDLRKEEDLQDEISKDDWQDI